jgi:sugar diacid utilization regulator
VRRLIGDPSVFQNLSCLDRVLEALVELTEGADALVALLRPPRGLLIRTTPGLGEPSPRAVRDLVHALRGASGDVTLPSVDGRLTAISLEVGDGSIAVAALGSDGADRRAVFEKWAPVLLLGVARAAVGERDRRRAEEVRRLTANTKRIAASLDYEDVLTEIVRDAVELLRADSGDISLCDPRRKVMRVVAAVNFPSELVGVEVGLDEGLAGRVLASRRPLMVSDYSRYPRRVRRLEAYGFRALLCAPLIVHGEPIGVLGLQRATDSSHAFDAEDARLLAAFADHAAIAIDNAERYQREASLASSLAQVNEQLTRSLTLQQRLVEQVLQDRGLASIATELASVLGRSIVVQDHLLTIVAGASPDGSDDWRSLALPAEMFSDRELASFLGEVRGGGARSAPLIAPLGTAPRLVAPIPTGSVETPAYLVVTGEHDFTPLEAALIEVASTGVALELGKVRARVEVERRLLGDVALDLVTGAYSSMETIAARASSIGYDLTQPRDVIVFRIDDFEARTASMGERDLLELRRRFFDETHGALRADAPASMVVSQRDRLIVLAAQGPRRRGGYAGREPRHIALRLKDLLERQLPDVTVSAAIGDRCTEPAQYAPSVLLAQRALDAAAKLGRSNELMEARDLGIYQLIISAASPDELREFALHTLRPLLDLGTQGSELVATLRTYVDTGFNQRETARRSFLHVNTVANRLKRVEQVLGIDLREPQSLLDLAFALQIGLLMGLF